MGIALARALRARGAEVELVLGPVSAEPQIPGIRVTRVQTAEEMYNACHLLFPQSDIAVMAAAVADYTPREKAKEKIKKQEGEWSVSFIRTRDILKSLGAIKKQHQVLVGFALETFREKEHALEKLHGKNADMIVLNSLNDPGAGFGHDTNKVTIFDREGREYHFDTKSKDAVAADIVDRITRTLHA
jgi:phosphopantothenoylcysteine decarboxylase/phosphopantothenate--cysteine ligase